MLGKPALTKPGDGYMSDFDQFLHGYLDQHPEVVEDRQRGWYIWWDHRVDLDEIDKLQKDEVPEKPYHYEWMSYRNLGYQMQIVIAN